MDKPYMSGVEETPNFKRKIVSSLLWQGTSNFTGQAISWLCTILVIRFLSPEDYGLMAMANLFFALLLTLSEAGMGGALIQATELTHADVRRVQGLVLITHLASFAMVFFGAPLAAELFREPRLILMLKVGSFAFLLSALYVTPEALLRRDLDYRIKARVDIAATVSSAVLSLVLAALGCGVWSLVGAVFALHLVKAVGFNTARPSLTLPAFSFWQSWRLVRFGAVMTFDRLVHFLSTKADVAILGRVWGKEILGLYSVALNLASIPMEKAMPIITTVSFSAFSRIQHDRERLRKNLLRSVRLTSVVAFPIFWGAAVVAPSLIPLVLGPQWTTIVVPFQLLAITLPLRTISVLISPPLFAIGKPEVNLVNKCITLACMFVAFLVGVQYGLIGMCLAWVIAFPIVFAVTTWWALRYLGIPIAQFAAQMLTATVGVLAMVAVLAVVIWAMPAGLPEVVAPLVLVSCGIVIYTAVLWCFDREFYSQYTAAIFRFRRPSADGAR